MAVSLELVHLALWLSGRNDKTHNCTAAHKIGTTLFSFTPLFPHGDSYEVGNQTQRMDSLWFQIFCC